LNELPQSILNDWPLWGLSSESDSATTIDGDALKVDVIEGGLTNQNFLLQTSVGKFVLRLHNASASLGINRDAELAVQQLAATAGLTPGILYNAPDHSYSVRPYIDGKILSATAISQSDLSAMADILSRLHNLPVPEGQPILDTHSACRLYLTDADDSDTKHSLLLEVDALPSLPDEDYCICHLDPLAANWIRDTSGKLWLLDWEYAAVTHRLLDYAAVDLWLPHALKADWRRLLPAGENSLPLIPLATAHIRLLDRCWRLAHQE